jgi:hypothetical protein
MSVISTYFTSSPRELQTINEVDTSSHSVQPVDVVLAEMFGLQGPESYAYTSQSNCLEVSDIDDVHDYSETIVRRTAVIFH